VKSLLYAALLLAVLLAFVILLRSFEGDHRPVHPEAGKSPVSKSAPPVESKVDVSKYAESSAEDLYSTALVLFGLWHVREATILFERAVAADSTIYGAWVKLVECYAHPLVGREDDAIAALARARALGGGDGQTEFLAGIEQLFIVRDYVAAASALERASKTGAAPQDATYYRALALLLSGRVEEAQKAIGDPSRHEEMAGRLAELHVRSLAAARELGAAGDEARELARRYPEEPYPYVVLALVEQMSGRKESAASFCNNALVLDSKYIPAILARGNLYAAAGDFEAARVSFEKLLMFDDPLLSAFGHEGIGFVDFLSGRFSGGVDAMDEAIRSAMLAGAVRRGLSISTQLVGYLCELGRADAAAEVVERWVTGFGDIPVALANLRIDILEGDLEAASRVLREIQSSKDWSEWVGMMSIDSAKMAALVHIGAGEYEAALNILSSSPGGAAVQRGSRLFLEGYASFDRGMAEEAAASFAEVGELLYGLEVPYHGDPVEYVRSLFYLGETSIARGNESAATGYYQAFLRYWGDADWDVQAVARARQRLESPAMSPSE
jgi:tetratricopeptide (TPR) repeat protein